MVEAAISNGAFAINKSSVFNDEGQWRTPSRKKLDPDAQDTLSGTLVACNLWLLFGRAAHLAGLGLVCMRSATGLAQLLPAGSMACRD